MLNRPSCLSRRWISLVALLAMGGAARLAQAQAGPPLVTDDPGTPGPNHWEVNVATTYEAAGREWTTELPLIDANYGVGQTLQLKVEAPWLIDHLPDGQRRIGSGNALLGVKWRFLDQGDGGFAVSTYPQVEVETPGSNSYRRGLVEATPTLLLPLEATHAIGPLEMDAEAGTEIPRHGRPTLIYGLAAGHVFTPRLELVGEFHGASSATFGDAESLVNVGARVTMTPHYILLVSGGHTLRTPSGLPGGALAYGAIQLVR